MIWFPPTYFQQRLKFADVKCYKALTASPSHNLPLCHSLTVKLFASSFYHYSSHPRLTSVLHLLLASDRKRQLPFDLALILLANGPLLIQWLTRSPPTTLNAHDNKESGFLPLGNRCACGPRPLNLALWWWWNNGHMVLYRISVCVSACPNLHRALCFSARSVLATEVPEGGGGVGWGWSHSSHPAHTSCWLCVFFPLYIAFGLVCLCVPRVSVKPKPESCCVTQTLMYVIICTEFSVYSST